MSTPNYYLTEDVDRSMRDMSVEDLNPHYGMMYRRVCINIS